MTEINEQELSNVISVAHQYGWNGVENSKILSHFLASRLQERDQLATALRAVRSAVDKATDKASALGDVPTACAMSLVLGMNQVDTIARKALGDKS